MNNISISRHSLVSACSVYLCIPVLLFFCFYLNPVCAILFSFSLVAVNALFIVDSSKNNKEIKDYLSLSPLKMAVIILFAVVLCFMAGIGEFVWSSYDHLVRWATLNDMVQYKWPIVYDLSTQQNPAVHEYLGDGNAAFSYYLTFWIVPALIGKLTNLFVARIALMVWSAVGVTLVLLGILMINRNKLSVVLIMFLFFGGLDYIPYVIQDSLGFEVTNPEAWNAMFVVNGTYDQMMNVFNQCIPAWLIVIMLLLSRNNKSVGFIGALLFAYTPWATIGLVPIAGYVFVANSSDRKKLYRDLLTVNNLLFPAIALITFGSLYTMNSSAVSISGFAWQTNPDIFLLIAKYAGYIVVEFGIWFLILSKKYKSSPLYWVLLIEFLIFPIYQITEFNDLLMRGTIAPYFILTIWVIDYVNDFVIRIKKNKTLDVKTIVIIFVLAISMMTQFILISTSIASTLADPEMSESRRHDINSFGNINNEDFAYLADYQFLIRDYESTFFFKYLAK